MLALADLLRDRGQAAAAAEGYTHALAGFAAAQDRIGEAPARAGLAAMLAQLAGEAMEARVQYRVAARIFTEFGLEEKATAAGAAAQALDSPGTASEIRSAPT